MLIFAEKNASLLLLCFSTQDLKRIILVIPKPFHAYIKTKSIHLLGTLKNSFPIARLQISLKKVTSIVADMQMFMSQYLY